MYQEVTEPAITPHGTLCTKQQHIVLPMHRAMISEEDKVSIPWVIKEELAIRTFMVG